MSGAARIEIFSGQGGGWYWRVVAGNGEIVAQSETYTRREDAVRGAEHMQVAVADAEIVPA